MASEGGCGRILRTGGIKRGSGGDGWRWGNRERKEAEVKRKERMEGKEHEGGGGGGRGEDRGESSHVEVLRSGLRGSQGNSTRVMCFYLRTGLA